MNAHDLAKKLLSGPNYPILVPRVVEYSDDEENSCGTPVITEDIGQNQNGEEIPILIIDCEKL